jgi:hypothetical protein
MQINAVLSELIISELGKFAAPRREPMSQQKSDLDGDRVFILFFRLTMGWTFLWAAIHHFGDEKFVLGFLSHVKTFHDVYQPFTNPAVLPVLTFLVDTVTC